MQALGANAYRKKCVLSNGRKKLNYQCCVKVQLFTHLPPLLWLIFPLSYGLLSHIPFSSFIPTAAAWLFQLKCN